MFLDAALVMRRQPVEHLLEVSAALLQQQANGYSEPACWSYCRKTAEKMWDVCQSASLVSSTHATELFMLR